MEFVQPIRDIKQIETIKKLLKQQSMRDYCLFVLGINSGLRISDLLKLKISDVSEKGKVKDRIRLREKKTNKFKDFPISPERLCSLIKLIENNTISNKQAREVFNEMLKDLNTSPKDIATKLGLVLITNTDELIKIIDDVIKNNQQSIIDYKNGKDRALGYLLGQVMKASKGQANPNLAKQIVLEKITKE